MVKKRQISLRNLKRIAYNQVRKEPENLEELERFLKDWWSAKFNLPDNHPLLLDKTLEELIVMYYKDVFRDKDSETTKQYEEEEGIIKGKQREDEEWFRVQMGKEEYERTKTLNSVRDEVEQHEFIEVFDVVDK